MIPPRTILAAIDFSDSSRAALTLAARLAQQCRATLHVAHAEHPLLDAAAGHAGIDLTRETQEELQRFVDATPPAAACAPRLHVATGPAVDVLLDIAHRQQADLVVVGSHGMSGAARLVFGSTTEGVLRRSGVSVLVAPTGWVAPRQAVSDLSGVGPVVVGIDPADGSVTALDAACTLATLIGTTVEVVHVVPDLAVLDRWRAHADIAVRDRVASARKDIEGLVHGLACTVPVQVRVEVGVVADRLADAAAVGGDRAPLIVLGRKAPGSHGGAPGTIAYRVLSALKVPVLMYVDA